MINADQPTIFKSSPIKLAVSSVEDGEMHPKYESKKTVHQNILSISKNPKTCLIRAIYKDRKYDVIEKVDKKSVFIKPDFEPVIISDALSTSSKGISLALPVADCLAVVIYDPKNHIAALAHMGRHATVDNLLPKLVKHMDNEYSSRPEDLVAYFSPSIKKSHYAMDYWNHADDPSWKDFCEEKNDKFYLDLPGFNKNQLIKSGVQEKNIEISKINTATDNNYGSHYTHELNRTKTASRFLVSVELI